MDVLIILKPTSPECLAITSSVITSTTSRKMPFRICEFWTLCVDLLDYGFMSFKLCIDLLDLLDVTTGLSSYGGWWRLLVGRWGHIPKTVMHLTPSAP